MFILGFFLILIIPALPSFKGSGVYIRKVWVDLYLSIMFYELKIELLFVMAYVLIRIVS
jgi:hypothetical protein